MDRLEEDTFGVGGEESEEDLEGEDSEEDGSDEEEEEEVSSILREILKMSHDRLEYSLPMMTRKKLSLRTLQRVQAMKMRVRQNRMMRSRLQNSRRRQAVNY